MTSSTVDSSYAWGRLAAAMAISGIGGVGMWTIPVVLPYVQAEFGVQRGAASFPYAMTMLGLAIGGLLLGRLADLRGIRLVLTIGAIGLGAGYALAANARNLTEFVIIHGLIIGALGSAASFGPLVADASLWFEKRRGLAVALCASGNYIAGAFWPAVVQWGTANYGWRATYLGIAIGCMVTIVPLLAMFARKPPALASAGQGGMANMDTAGSISRLGLNPKLVFALLLIAGVACCVGMSMPQVHIVAYCSDLGYGAARGAEMLSLMLACGIVSRLTSGWLCDKIGGFSTLLLSSALQCLVLIAYLPFDSLTSLYVVSGLFGLVQGGIVPSYAIVVRDLYPANEAGTRVSAVLMATVAGMALGGWLSGVIFDYTGSYRAAFLHSIAWNLLNILIVLWLVNKRYPRGGSAVPA